MNRDLSFMNRSCCLPVCRVVDNDIAFAICKGIDVSMPQWWVLSSIVLANGTLGLEINAEVRRRFLHGLPGGIGARQGFDEFEQRGEDRRQTLAASFQSLDALGNSLLKAIGEGVVAAACPAIVEGGVQQLKEHHSNCKIHVLQVWRWMTGEFNWTPIRDNNAVGVGKFHIFQSDALVKDADRRQIIHEFHQLETDVGDERGNLQTNQKLR